jgi:prephenate dehydratase
MLTHQLRVTAETTINIDYVLVAARGTNRGTITRVLSHPIALAQCTDFFRQNRGMEAVSVFDTAGAVRLATESGDRQTAAIASRKAAALYGADILQEHIQDQRDNWTRFLLLGSAADAETIEQPQKAIIACGLRHESGALVKALQPIAAHGLSVTKIEGRPIAGTEFEYRFIVQVTAPEGESIPAAVYDELRAATTSFNLLGAFRLGPA